MLNLNKNAKSPKRTTSSRDTSVTILTEGCEFNGRLFCRGSSRIGGLIEGEIRSEGLLIVEETAVIRATIYAEEAIIQGKVYGRLEANSRVELCADCYVQGDIITPSLVIQEGAAFNGSCDMSGTAGQANSNGDKDKFKKALEETLEINDPRFDDTKIAALGRSVAEPSLTS